MRKYCALWSLPPLNDAAADQRATPPPPVKIGRRAAAAAETFSVGADVEFERPITQQTVLFLF